MISSLQGFNVTWRIRKKACYDTVRYVLSVTNSVIISRCYKKNIFLFVDSSNFVKPREFSWFFVKMVYKLYYFDVRALAEPIRMLLTYGNIEFEDHRVSFADWMKHKDCKPFMSSKLILKLFFCFLISNADGANAGAWYRRTKASPVTLNLSLVGQEGRTRWQDRFWEFWDWQRDWHHRWFENQ